MEEETLRKRQGFSHPRPLNHVFKVVGDIAVFLEEIGFVLLFRRNQCRFFYGLPSSYSGCGSSWGCWPRSSFWGSGSAQASWFTSCAGAGAD